MRASFLFLCASLGCVLVGCVPSFDDITVVDAGMDAAAVRMDASTSGMDGGVDASFDAGMQPELDADHDVGVDACVPVCITGGACGADDGCGGRCLGDCPNVELEVCYGGYCGMSWCASSRCDVFSGTGCTTGQACYHDLDDDPDFVATRCAAAGAGLEGDACRVHDDCAAGFGCQLGKCRRYCCHAGQLFTESSDHCAGYCERFGFRTGYCVVPCDTENPDSCAADQLCVWSSERAGLKYCIETVAPNAQPGDSCGFANACAHGQFCHEGACRTTCDPDASTCPGGTMCTTVATTPNISVCLPN